jgi:glutathione S-transferase
MRHALELGALYSFPLLNVVMLDNRNNGPIREGILMKLIDQPRAPNPRRVNIFLAEKGIEIPTEELNIPGKEHLTPEIKSLNPVQTLPILVLDDGTAISESVAICRYFEELQPEPPLMGTTPLEKATIEMWQRRMELNLMNNVAAVFRHSHPAMAELEVPQVADWAEANRPRVQRALEMLDAQLANNQYVAGNSYSIADITALVGVDFTKMGRIEVPDTLTNLARWRAEVSSRPSAKAGMSKS